MLLLNLRLIQMPAERYFISSSLHQNDSVILKENEFHHLVHVMRGRKGDQIELVNGQGTLAEAVVQEIGKDQAKLLVQHSNTVAPRPHRVILAQAMPKLNRLDFILEKGTELGVDEFWLFPGDRSVKKEVNSHQLDRMQTLVISAMKQCGRLFIPSIVLKPELAKWPSIEGNAFFGDVSPEAPLFTTRWQNLPLQSPILFFIGPESGFSDKETDILRQKGAHGVKLHTNILRTDTAPLMALSLIEHWLLT